MDIAITKMSSKGQIVIPQEMRGNLKEGDKMLVIKSDDRILLKKASQLDKNMVEDLEFARRTEEALKEYDKGKFKTMELDEFIKEIKKW